MNKIGAWALVAVALSLSIVHAQQRLIQGTDISGLSFTALGATASRQLNAMLGDTLNVLDFGAVCNGSTDDAAAINSALSSGAKTIQVPGQSCRVASTITIPAGVTLRGLSFNPGNPPSGSEILCDATVTPCVTSAGSNSQATLDNITVAHAGSPASTTIGVQITGAYNAQLIGVMSYNSGVCYQFTAQPASGTGLGAIIERGYSGKCQDAHIVAASWPELKIISGRFGMNGSGDYAANAFIRIQGGIASTSGGPNTIYALGAQFNQGGTPVSHFMEFVNLGAGGVPSIDATDFRIEANHIENISGAIVYTDNTWNILNRIEFANNSINTSGIPFFLLNAATDPSIVQVIGNYFAGSDITLNSVGASDFVIAAIIANNALYAGSINLFGTSGATGVVVGNSVANGISLTGVWGSLSVGPNTYVGGSVTSTATGGVNINEVTKVVVNGVASMSCTGMPSSSFATTNGIVTHC